MQDYYGITEEEYYFYMFEEKFTKLMNDNKLVSNEKV
jgi:hypothetical protein